MFLMANIFTLENISDFSGKLNIDELYEKKRQYDLNQLTLFNKILNRIHVRIRTVSRQRLDEHFCWFIVPEMIIGVPKYDQGACIAYLMSQLKENGFNIKYIHPNTLFISWMHWVPSYVRTELKKKTGIIVNEYGVKVDDNGNGEASNNNGNMMDDNENSIMSLSTKPIQQQGQDQKQKKNYTPINSYKPSGNLLYDAELLSQIEEKIT
jgi:hypothetical protein